MSLSSGAAPPLPPPSSRIRQCPQGSAAAAAATPVTGASPPQGVMSETNVERLAEGLSAFRCVRQCGIALRAGARCVRAVCVSAMPVSAVQCSVFGGACVGWGGCACRVRRARLGRGAACGAMRRGAVCVRACERARSVGHSDARAKQSRIRTPKQLHAAHLCGTVGGEPAAHDLFCNSFSLWQHLLQSRRSFAGPDCRLIMCRDPCIVFS